MAVGLRDKAVYSNIMYALLSEIVLSATGKPLAQNFKELIFDPLGMRHTCCGALVADTEITWACPYREEEGKAIDLPLFPTDNIGGGGFVNSTSDDMLRWLEMLLAAERGARGRAPGARLIAPETFQECVSPQIRYATLTLNWDDVFAMRSYGFGWILETYRGRRVWRHGGGIEGFFGCALLFPDEGIGIAALTNTNGRHFCESMSFEVADRLLGVGGIDWSARLAREREIEAARVAGLRDSDLGPASGAERSLAPAACCGRYTHPGFGEMRVFQRGEALWLGCAALELPLCHHGGDCFYLGTAELTVPATPIRFTASGGSAVALRAVLEPMPPRDEVVFDRVS
jgi:CubicO group peptidase (beta-lactamase class C family)